MAAVGTCRCIRERVQSTYYPELRAHVLVQESCEPHSFTHAYIDTCAHVPTTFLHRRSWLAGWPPVPPPQAPPTNTFLCTLYFTVQSTRTTRPLRSDRLRQPALTLPLTSGPAHVCGVCGLCGVMHAGRRGALMQPGWFGWRE